MTYTMEGKEKNFFIAGLTLFISAFVLIILGLIYSYILINTQDQIGFAIFYTYSSEVVKLIGAIIVNIFLFIGFTNLDTRINLKSYDDTQSITKLILAQIILIGLQLLSFSFTIISIIGNYFMIVVGVLHILSGVIGLFTYLLIFKFIRKQASDGMAKLVSIAFLAYSITFLLNDSIYGLFYLGINGTYLILQPLVTASSSLNSIISITVAFILILFSIKLSTAKPGIIVPKSLQSTIPASNNCQSCGQLLEPDEQFCVNCGKKVE